MTLAEFPMGEPTVVSFIEGKRALRRRLMDMGLIESRPTPVMLGSKNRKASPEVATSLAMTR